MSDVKCLTLRANMMTVMGQVSNSVENDFGVILKHGVVVLLVPPQSESDRMTVTFSPFLNYTKEFKTGIEIRKSDILATTTPMPDLLNRYNEIFGSGIVLASSLNTTLQ